MTEIKVSSTQLLIQAVVASAIEPAMECLPFKMGAGVAKVFLVAAGLQESDLTERRQLGNGPARGLWQFEQGSSVKGGGVWGVFKHAASREYLRTLCTARGVEYSPQAIYHALEADDVLAAGVARLLMWTDRLALPTSQDAAWAMYSKRTWCPGKPKPEKWPSCWAAAVSFGLANGWVKPDGKGGIQ